MKQAFLERLPLAAFIGSTLFGGLNAIGVRYTVLELPPFWGATLRFFPASLLLFGLAAVLRLPLPRGSALRGAVVFGLLNFGLSYAFLYWGLQEVQPGMTQVTMALGPLLTLVFVILHGQEKFRWRALAGSLLAVAGIALIFGEQVQAKVPLLSLLSILAGTASMAEAGVVIKGYPKSHPITTNALGMGVGALLLFSCSLLLGETQAVPTQAATWAALGYLIVFGSCAVFILLLYVLKHWTASATSYAFVLLPFVTVTASAVLIGERITPIFLIGAAVVLAGVYFGAIGGSRKPVSAQPSGRPVEGVPD